MPGTNDGAPDEIESILDSSAELDQENIGQEADPIQSDQSAQLQEPVQPHGAPKQTTGQAPKQVDWKSRFTELKKRYDPVAQRKNTLEKLLSDPELRKIAKTNPRLADALLKAGIQRAAEENEDEVEGGSTGASQAPWDPANNPMHAVMEMKLNYEWDRQEASLERELGRNLAQEEKNAIYDKMRLVSGLTIKEAFMLTPAYQKIAKEAEDKRIEAAIKRLPGGRRPPPPNPLSSGKKIDLKKDVRALDTDEERAAVINDIMESSG